MLKIARSTAPTFTVCAVMASLFPALSIYIEASQKQIPHPTAMYVFIILPLI